MFQAACAAFHRPAARPTRGSGVGAVIETIGVTGAGITAGGGSGGGGGVPPPRPPRPPPPAGGSAAAAPAPPAGGVATGGCTTAGGAAGGGTTAGTAGCVTGGGAGVVAGADFGPHAAAMITAVTRDAAICGGRLHGVGSFTASICRMRSISIVWSAWTSAANLYMSSSCRAP